MSLQAHFGFAPLKGAGEVGIEIEVEGFALPQQHNLSRNWKAEVDNSLRGESREFVLTKPCVRESVGAVLGELEQAYKDCNTRVNDTYRAGIHIHINVQDLLPRELMNFIFLYLMYEEVLIDFCDPSRKGNHFCLRVSDASYLAEMIAEAVVSGNFSKLNSDDVRYASLNLKSLFRYGSLEFRALESTNNWKKIEDWTNLLLALKDAAKNFSDPTEIIGAASVNGMKAFAELTFGKMFPVIAALYSDEKVYTGIRNIQFAAYSRNWQSRNLNIFKASKDLFT